jgi:PAS domain S-box-containing protein
MRTKDATHLSEDPKSSSERPSSAGPFTDNLLALKGSEETYKTLLENIPTAIIATDLEGNITTWNKAAEDIYGWGREEAIGRNIKMLFKGENLPLLDQRREVLMTLGRCRGEGLAVRKDGKTFRQGFFLSLVRDGQGRPRGYVGIIADITERYRRAREKELLGNVNKAIASGMDIKEIYEIFIQELKKLIDFDTIDIVLLEERDLPPLLQAKEGSLPYSHLLQRVVTAGRPIIEHYSTGDSTTQPLFLLGFPLEYKGNIIGVLKLSSPRVEDFSTEQLELLGQIVPQLSLAIINKRIDKNLRMQLEELQQLNETALELVKETELQALLDKIAINAARLIKGSSSQACLLEEDFPMRPVIISSHGIDKEILKKFHIYKTCPCLSAIKNGQTIFVPDTLKDPRWKSLCEANLRTFLSVPVSRKDGRLIGAITLYSPEPYSIKDFETQIVEMYATQVSAALENAYLYKEVIHSEKRYKELYDGAPCMYASFSADGTILQCNKACLDILSYEREELIGKSIYSFLSPGVREWTSEKLQQCMAEGHVEAEVQFMKKDGTTIDTSLKATCLYGSQTEVREIRAVLTNITEEKKFRERLLQIEKLRALGEMASGVAHEFNNILAIILGNVQLLQGNPEDVQQLKDGLSIIRQSALDGAETIRRLQESTRIKSDSSRLLTVDITALIREVIQFSRPRWMVMAKAKDVSYDVDVEGLSQVPATLANPTELREVFINILNNALDAMPNGGTISFKTWTEEDSIFVSISDTGVGMTREVQKKIFDPFFTTKGSEGSGLGMSLVYGIITRHRGEIDTDSQPGKATTITIRLPITQEPPQPLPLPPPQQEKPFVKLKILVIDDETEICRFLSKGLSQEGHEVKWVTRGREALNLVREESFDVVLCDLAMPGISGWEVVKTLKNMEKRPRIGILTGWGNNAEAIQRKDSAVDFLIGKPIDLHELCRLIHK